MHSLEQTVKDQFAEVFTSCDWQLFKDFSEINFAEAARLKKSLFSFVSKDQRLRIRNIRKRLLIGIGVELLLKSVYLKAGYSINKPLRGSGLEFPFKLDVSTESLDKNDTFTLSKLISELKNVIPLSEPEVALHGLLIAKVFRNKEGHVVTRDHEFDPSSYRAIEAALVEIYACAFNETLEVHFSLENNEKWVWCVHSN